jgi:hypothetical protein
MQLQKRKKSNSGEERPAGYLPLLLCNFTRKKYIRAYPIFIADLFHFVKGKVQVAVELLVEGGRGNVEQFGNFFLTDVFSYKKAFDFQMGRVLNSPSFRLGPHDFLPSFVANVQFLS